METKRQRTHERKKKLFYESLSVICVKQKLSKFTE